MRKQERGLTVGNLRELGFHSLHARCLNLRCRHHWQLSIDDQANGMKLTALGRRTICNRCGASARKSVRPGESSAWPANSGGDTAPTTADATLLWLEIAAVLGLVVPAIILVARRWPRWTS